MGKEYPEGPILSQEEIDELVRALRKEKKEKGESKPSQVIALIDYEVGNLRSVAKALENCSARVSITSNPEDLRKACAIVLPGVGAFSRGIDNLKSLGIFDTILDEVKNKKKPFLGICLGLQLLFTRSYEYGESYGFGFIEGEVVKFSSHVKVPHMGWNRVKKSKRMRLLEGIPDNAYFYFAHSYYVKPTEEKTLIKAFTFYGEEFVSAIEKENIFGVQFHPEKSSTLGLKVLENFVKIAYKNVS